MAAHHDQPEYDYREITTGDKSLVLFDGVCHFCNNSVNFIIDRDPGKHFLFAPLQSKYAQPILQLHGENTEVIDSIILICGNKIYKRSRAALEIAKRMKAAWPLFYFFIVVPGPVRDFFYNIIAKNRYKWFGRMDACRIPTPAMRERYRD